MTLLWTCLVLFQAAQGEPDQALLRSLVGLTSTGPVVAASGADRGRRARLRAANPITAASQPATSNQGD
jgi:hypothetical protein